jgi:hypothetical protein
MSKVFLTQKEKIYLRNMKNRGIKVPSKKLKEIYGKYYISPEEYLNQKS